MSGARHRRKGNRVERELVQLHNRLLWADHIFVADRLMSDLEYGIEIEAGGTPNNDGLDIPDYLKRDAKAGAA